RFYDPLIQQYIEPEPLLSSPGASGFILSSSLQAQHPSVYGYAFNNPLYYTDPTGFAPCGPMDSTVSCCIKQHPENPSQCTGEDPPTPPKPEPQPNQPPADECPGPKKPSISKCWAKAA